MVLLLLLGDINHDSMTELKLNCVVTITIKAATKLTFRCRRMALRLTLVQEILHDSRFFL